MLFVALRGSDHGQTAQAAVRVRFIFPLQSGRMEVVLKFTKMEGLGNDYVYVNCLEETVEDPARLSIRVSDRHFGIGSDGLILIRKSDKADFGMDMYNADGSRGKMCGNGIRCVGKYVYDHGLTAKTRLTISTLSGIKELALKVSDGKVSEVRVDMGAPSFSAEAVPVLADTDRVMMLPCRIGDMDVSITCVSMGNPHCVVPTGDPSSLDLEKCGPSFEKHPMFPEGVNTEFISIEDAHTLVMRVWERGSGETLACGTGACASAAAAIRNGWASSPVKVRLRGGELLIEWNGEEDGHVYMTGPARTVFEGEIEV